MIKEIKLQSFMTSKLGLSGNELVLFGICWKESKGGEQEFALDYTEVSAAMGTTIPTMYNCINKLMGRGYLLNGNGKSVYKVAV